MSSKNPKDSFMDRQSQLISTMKLIKKEHHSFLGDIELYKLNNGTLFVKKYDTNNQQEAENLQKECNK